MRAHIAVVVAGLGLQLTAGCGPTEEACCEKMAESFHAKGDTAAALRTLEALEAGRLALLTGACGEFRDACLQRTLGAMIREEGGDLRGAAARAAATEGFEALVPDITQVLAESQDPDDRAGAARALAKLAPEALKRHLEGMLDDRNTRVAVAAMELTAEVAPEVLRKRLGSLLDDERWPVRAAAAAQALELGAKPWIAELVPLLQASPERRPESMSDEEYAAREDAQHVASEALGGLEGEAVERALVARVAAHHTCYECVRVLQRVKADEALVGLLEHDHSTLRYVVIEALMARKAKGAVPKLLELVQHAESDSTRGWSARALGALGDASVAPTLRERLAVEPAAHVKTELQAALARVDPKAEAPEP